MSPGSTPLPNSSLPSVDGHHSAMPSAALAHEDFLAKHGPIDPGVQEAFPDGYTGDQPDRRHAFLWNKKEMIAKCGGLPAVTERVPVVVIGGGMAGLAVTDLLKDRNPVLLEQAERLGGTSKGEVWEGTPYALGAAYFVKPFRGTPIHDYLNGLGVIDRARYHEGGLPIELGGRIYADVFSGETDLLRAHEFQNLAQHLRKMSKAEDGLKIPEVPANTPAEKAEVDALDQESLYDYLVRLNGGELPPHLLAALEHYCWSALGGSMREVSAAVGLNFLAPEFGEIGVLPAGNASIAEAILKRILTVVPEGSIRCGAVVVDVEVAPGGVLVTYVDGEDRLHRINAEAVVLSCPKFVTARLLRGIDESRVNDIRQGMRYRSYLVANVFVNQKNPNKDLFDVVLLGDGKVNMDEVESDSRRKQVADVVIATYASPESERSVLTLYMPLPFDAGMAKMLDPQTLQRMVADFSYKIINDILPTFGFDPSNLAGMRVTRWGHALPLAAKGLMASGLTARIQEPFQRRVFFAESDNESVPSLESALASVFRYVPAVRELLDAPFAGV